MKLGEGRNEARKKRKRMDEGEKGREIDKEICVLFHTVSPPPPSLTAFPEEYDQNTF